MSRLRPSGQGVGSPAPNRAGTSRGPRGRRPEGHTPALGAQSERGSGETEPHRDRAQRKPWKKTLSGVGPPHPQRAASHFLPSLLVASSCVDPDAS